MQLLDEGRLRHSISCEGCAAASRLDGKSMIAGWLASENGAMTRDHATEASAGAAWTQRDGSTEQGTAERGITQTAVGRHPLGY